MPADFKELISDQPQVRVEVAPCRQGAQSFSASVYKIQATAPMAAGGNRNALNLEVGLDGRRDWSFGLFDCTSDRRLCMSTKLA